MKRHGWMVAWVFSAIAALPAQELSGEVSPSPAEQGQPITVTVTEAGIEGVVFLDGCIIKEVREKSPAGNTVWLAQSCPDVYIELFHGESISDSWDQRDLLGQTVPPGDYALRVDYVDNSNLRSKWFAARIQGDAAEPRLLALTRAGVGIDLMLGLDAPDHSDGIYVAAVSATLDRGFDTGLGQHAALDMDALFEISFPRPDAGIFSGFQGSLDSLGQASGLVVSIPLDPALEYLGFHVQAMVSGPGPDGAPRLTNVVSVTIGA